MDSVINYITRIEKELVKTKALHEEKTKITKINIGVVHVKNTPTTLENVSRLTEKIITKLQPENILN